MAASKESQDSIRIPNEKNALNFNLNGNIASNSYVSCVQSNNEKEKKFVCIVCCQEIPSFRHKAIFAIGPCNHLVCYHCSTKIRVLCEQNECPICRQDILEIIFTTNKNVKFSRFETKKCIEYDSRYKIYFENEECFIEFYKLLQHRCTICNNNDTLFSNLKELELHLKKVHDLYLCELCTSHLKVFSFERKYYNWRELSLHKKTGDLDNKSHKGHPTCNLCSIMFFDEDELLSHLRRDHFSCYFCDPGRSTLFFDNSERLKVHFKQKHYVCEEDECCDEIFTSAFVNKIDLQAHQATVHNNTKFGNRNSKSLVVDFELQMENTIHGVQSTCSYSNRNYNDNNYFNDISVTSTSNLGHQQSVPTAEDFPTLNSTASGSNNQIGIDFSLLKKQTNTQSFSSKIKFSGPNKEEEFPALESNTTDIPFFAQKKFTSKKINKNFNKNGPHPSTSNKNNSLKYADMVRTFPPLENTSVDETWTNPLPTFKSDDFPEMFIKVKKSKKKTQYINNNQSKNNKNDLTEESSTLKKENNENKNGLKVGLITNTITQVTQNENNSNVNNGKFLSLKLPPGLFQIKQVSDKSTSNFKENKDDEEAFKMKTLGILAEQIINEEKFEPCTSKKGYIYSSSFDQRNKALYQLIKSELKVDSKLESFKNLTNKFRRGQIDGDLYFRKCLELFGKNFLNLVFVELLVLMPDIKKQTEILSAYEKYFIYNKGAIQKRNFDGTSKGIWIFKNEKIDFLVCPVCQQVLGKGDGAEHMSCH